MAEFQPITDGLDGKPCPERAAIAFQDADAADHIVEELVSRAEQVRRNGRAVVLQTDPAGDDYRRCQDQL